MVEDMAERSLGVRAVPSDQMYDGRNLEDWAIEYARWSYSATSCENAQLDPDGSQCASYQPEDAKVFFFEHGTYSANPRAPAEKKDGCKVPSSAQAIFVPVAIFTQENAGLKKPLSDDELLAKAVGIKSSMRDMYLSVDGQDVPLSTYGIGPRRFSFQIPPAPNVYSCSDTPGVESLDVDPSFLVGYGAIVEVVQPGEHIFEYGSLQTYSGVNLQHRVEMRFVVDGGSG
jgi:hypothetical protein